MALELEQARVLAPEEAQAPDLALVSLRPAPVSSAPCHGAESLELLDQSP